MGMNLESRRLAAKENRDQLVRGLGWFSIGLGLTELLFPRTLGRCIGINPRTGLMRLLGLREIASGIGLLAQPQKDVWMKSRVAGDAMDLALLGGAFLDEENNRLQVGIAAGAVAGVTALDVFCANELAAGAGQSVPEAGKTPGAAQVKRSIIVNRSVEDLYKVWRNFEDFPDFMNHVLAVERKDNGRWHWTVKGPGGVRVEWDAEIVEERPNEFIAWRSLPNADVDNRGSVRFERAPGNRGTIIHVELHYRPPAGKAGAVVAKLMGQSPEKQIAVDLVRFKQLMETGEIARTEGQPAGRGRSTSRAYDDLVRA
ncbi:MAG TPA: SRPBCC family protein [Verrucomicrobiae bacterium]|nr:SRPBCC family protein [Verrucomicrobiae bacterium]